MLLRMLYDDKLAQASYLVGCQITGEALVIDPARDVDRYLKTAAAEGLKITAVAETHIHADFISGARELAEHTNARVYLSDEGDSDWKYEWLTKRSDGGVYDHNLLKDGETFKVGNVEIKAVHTPGHTPEHLSFLVTDSGGGASEPMGIATGDFVFVGDVGRPDLLETAAGQVGVKESSARVLFHSIQKFKALPDYLQLWPGHGAGSVCGKALGAVPQSTVGYEKRFNLAIADATDENQFVEGILHGQPEPPLYFARMKKENKQGPALLPKWPEPKELDIAEMERLLRVDHHYLLDTRNWTTFSESHLPGAVFAPLDKSFPTVAGSYVQPGLPIYLLIEAQRVPEAVTDLIHIGLDKIAGFITPETLAVYQLNGAKLQSIRRKEIDQITGTPENLILDVRSAYEHAAGRIPESKNIPYTRLAAHLAEIPPQKKILVYCQSGRRSGYASAFLQSRGFDTVQLDGGFDAWQAAGREIMKG